MSAVANGASTSAESEDKSTDARKQPSAKEVAKAASKKKDVFVDPEVVRRRREEKAAEKKRKAEAELEERARVVAEGGTLQADEPEPASAGFIKREFVRLPQLGTDAETPLESRRKLKLMSWNLLAQALVRRTLFPGSDLLKWNARGPVLDKVILHYDPDVACLQEVDKFEEHHRPNLAAAGYDTLYTTGHPAKLHGLCIAWKRDLLEQVGDRCVKLDDAEVEPGRTACSRVTRNIGLLTALQWRDSHQIVDAPKGVIVVTHHLFWHARHVYERARQIGLLLREIDRFRASSPEWADWPCFFAGDFNIQPSEGSYRLMTGAALSAEQEENLRLSAVVHANLDEQKRRLAEAARSGAGTGDDDADVKEDDDGEQPAGEEYAQPEGDEDRVLKNTRPARESDGLLSVEALRDLYRSTVHGDIESAYGSNYARLQDETGNWYGERAGKPDHAPPEAEQEKRVREGYYEPAWTNVTPLWRCTLDYIFIIPGEFAEKSHSQSRSCKIEVTRLLRTHRLEDLEPGLPRAGKEPSDHVAIMAQMEW